MTTPTESPEDISTAAPVIKNIVLSAVVGDGLDMRLINPVAA